MKSWWIYFGDELYLRLGHPAFLLAVGGALGTLARYYLGLWFSLQPWARTFPYGTLAVNVVGSFLLGVVAVVFLQRLPPAYAHWYLLLGTGFCGGFTTFSAFEYETMQLVIKGQWRTAVVNVGVSVAAAFLAVVMGVVTANFAADRVAPREVEAPSPHAALVEE